MTPQARFRLRLALLRLISIALRLRSRRLQITPGAVRVIIAPHQDDETLGAGGLIARCVEAGNVPFIVFITDGSGSHTRHPTLSPAAITELRRAEARAALAHLGVTEAQIHFLDAPDGRMARLDAAEATTLVARIGGVLATLCPDEVLLPFRRDGSSEHEAIFALFARALVTLPRRPRVLEFPVWCWWSPRLRLRPLLACARVWRLPLNRATYERKLTALALYPSQFEPLPPLTQSSLPAGFIRAFETPEEFFLEYPASDLPDSASA